VGGSLAVRPLAGLGAGTAYSATAAVSTATSRWVASSPRTTLCNDRTNSSRCWTGTRTLDDLYQGVEDSEVTAGRN
jgi:hypothetical protein